MIGEYRKNRDGGLSISPTAAKIFKTRMVDSGEEAKYLDIIQQVTMGAYEQPCQLYNRTVRFGIYWEWYQVTIRDTILWLNFNHVNFSFEKNGLYFHLQKKELLLLFLYIQQVYQISIERDFTCRQWVTTSVSQLSQHTRDELDDIVEDAEREFLIYLVVLGVFVLGCLVLSIW